MKLINYLLIGIFLLLTSILNVLADRITLSNGDQISGTVISLKNRVLLIRTDYSDSLRIDWTFVNKINIDSIKYISLTNQSILGNLYSLDQDKILIQNIAGIKMSVLKKEIIEFRDENKKNNSKKLSGMLDFGISTTSGNSDTKKIRAESEISKYLKNNKLSLQTFYNEAENSNIESESNWLLALKLDKFTKSNWYSFTKFNVENDKFKDIDLRTSIGFGVGLQVFDNSIKSLSIEFGGSYVDTDYINNRNYDFAAGTWGLDYKRFIGNNGLIFYHKNSGFFGLRNGDNLFVKTKTGFKFPLIQNVSIKYQLDYDWENAPSNGKHKEDFGNYLIFGYSW